MIFWMILATSWTTNGVTGHYVSVWDHGQMNTKKSKKWKTKGIVPYLWGDCLPQNCRVGTNGVYQIRDACLGSDLHSSVETCFGNEAIHNKVLEDFLEETHRNRSKQYLILRFENRHGEISRTPKIPCGGDHVDTPLEEFGYSRPVLHVLHLLFHS